MYKFRSSVMIITAICSLNVFAKTSTITCGQIIGTNADDLNLRSPITVLLKETIVQRSVLLNADFEYKNGNFGSSIEFEKKFSTSPSKLLDIGKLEDNGRELVLTSTEISGDSIGNSKGSGIIVEEFKFIKELKELDYSKRYISNEELSKNGEGELGLTFTLKCN